MIQPGYAIYFLTISGFAKIFGAMAILQNQFTVVKEWAFAGFAFTFIGTFLSRVFIGDGIGLLIPPMMMPVVMFLVYFYGRSRNGLTQFDLDKIMIIAVIIVRTLIGLLFLFASVTFFLNLAPPPDYTGNTKTFFDGLAASGYILPVSKVFELLCALAFISGRFVPLATVVIFPIILNILLINAIHLPSGLPIAIPLFLGNLFLVYANLEKFKPLLEGK